MKPSEWLEIASTIKERWPFAKMPEATVTRWGADLADLPAAQVSTALDAIYREGREHPPNAGQLRARVDELALDALDHGEAWGLVTEANRRFGLHREHGQAEALAWLESRSSAAAEAVRRFGPDALATYEIGQEGTIRAQFRDLYRGVVADQRASAAYAGLPDADLARVKRLAPAGGAISRARAELEPGEEAA